MKFDKLPSYYEYHSKREGVTVRFWFCWAWKQGGTWECWLADGPSLGDDETVMANLSMDAWLYSLGRDKFMLPHHMDAREIVTTTSACLRQWWYNHLPKGARYGDSQLQGVR